MKKLVVFDLDGTLIHSIPDIHDSINYMLAHYGFGEIDEDSIRHFVGNGARNLVKNSLEKCGKFLSDDKIDECLDFYNDYYTKSNSPKTRLFDGISEMLNELKNRGYILAIVTNKPQMTTDNVKNTYLNEFDFSYVVGSGTGVKRKPDATETNKIIQNANIDKKDVYFVGDGETDVLTSINAKVNGISVLWGYRTKDELIKAGAKIFAEKPADLLNIIN